MSLMISYEPPEGGNVSYIEVALSESYEDAINAACTLLKNRLPPDDCILGRYLARQMERGGEIRWARISEPLFRQLVQNMPEDLELRLELDTIQTSQRRRDTSSTPSSLIMPSPLLESNNRGIPILDDSSSITETGTTNNPSTPLHTPLTPTSLISMFDQSSNPRRSSGSTSIGNNKRSTYYQEPSIVDPPICLNPPTYPPSLASTNMARNRTFEDGLNAFFAGQFSNARTRFQLAADECHDTGDAFQEAECLLRLGMTCRHLKDYPAAISHLSTARTIYESLDSRREQLQCERNLARVSEDQGNYQESLRTYQEIKTSARAVGSQTEEAWCDYSIGRLYNRMCRHDDALQHLSQAIRTSKALNNQEIEAFATEESGHSAERQQHRDLAIQCYERALTMFKTQGRGRWVENENRVKKRLKHLGVKQNQPRKGFFGRRQSTSAT